MPRGRIVIRSYNFEFLYIEMTIETAPYIK